MNTDFYKQWFDERWPAWAAHVLKFLSRLVRTKIVGTEDLARVRCCIAHLHGDDLALIPHFGQLGITVLVSRSRDGEIIARAMLALGHNVTRGSSTRGAVGGLLALIKAVRAGNSVALTVDGPQGPRGVCKPGVVRVAQKTGVPMFPVGVATSRKFVFKKSWSQSYLTRPFARQVILFDEPLHFPNKVDALDMDLHCRRVEEALCSAQKRAEKMLKNR